MTILCKNCTHNSVCKHKFDYEHTIETLDTKVSTPFTLTLNCPFYKQEQYCYSGLTSINGTNVLDSAITATGTITGTCNDELAINY